MSSDLGAVERERLVTAVQDVWSTVLGLLAVSGVCLFKNFYSLLQVMKLYVVLLLKRG